MKKSKKMKIKRFKKKIVKDLDELHHILIRKRNKESNNYLVLIM